MVISRRSGWVIIFDKKLCVAAFKIIVSSLVHLGRYDEALKVLENAKKLKPGITIDSVENAFATKNEVDTLSIREALIEAGLPRQ